MGKTKSKKKKGLRSLILLLILTIVMFGTSTYAWFTANRVVTINSLDVHVEASNGIQISTDGANWKSVITNADIKTGAYSGNVNQVPATITAVSTDGKVNSSGRINMYSSVISNDAVSGDYTIKTALETDAQGVTGKYIAFDLFLRVDGDQTIYLTSDSDVTTIGNEERGLKNAARVAFIQLGHAASSATTNQLIALNDHAASPIKIWEPNSDSHTLVVVNSVAPDYSIDLEPILDDQDEPTGKYEPVEYRGVATTISTALDLRDVVNGTVYQNEDETVLYTKPVAPDIYTLEGNHVYKEFLDLDEGVTKFRIYMWLEGQDVDCENNATGSDISFKIQFSTQSGTPAQNP